jgi:hypothetical protein
MLATKPLAIPLALLVAATGVGAAVGSTHDTGTGSYALDAQPDGGSVTVTVARDGDPVENGERRASDREANADTGARQGSPASLPSQVPDHVLAIHDPIGSFLSGDSGTPGPGVIGAAR